MTTDVTDLLEKVLDAGANNIWSELRNIKGASSEEIEVASRRWVWELVQNASDCAEKDLGVNIKFDFDGEFLKFSHDGDVFIYKNLLDLITQISSKQSSDEEKTGKFGTGFISTHLLSPTINLRSYFKNHNNDYMPFEMLLDRSGETYDDIKRNIKEELEYVELIKEKSNEIRGLEMEQNFVTCFKYNVSHSVESKKAVEKGLHNLSLTIPYLLTFNKKIKSISINGLMYWIEEDLVNENTRKVTVSNLDEEKTVVMVFKENNTEVAFNLSLENSNEITELNPEIAKIFCDFPLVGTEKFSFPLIINNPTLDVLKDRDGIQEGANHNMQILEEAKSLYEKILNYVSSVHFKNLHHLCIVPAFNMSELNIKLLEQITKIYSKIPLVETNANGVYVGLRSIIEGKDNFVFMPYHSSEDLRDEMWHIVNSMLKMPIPTLETYKDWTNIIPNNCEITDINTKILMKNESLDKLIEFYQKEANEIIDWLNRFYYLWKKTFLEKESIDKVYILNQNLKFKQANELYKDRGIVEELKEVLKGLGKDIKEQLANTDLIIADEIINEYLEDKDIIKRIERKVDAILSDEAGLNNTKNRDEDIQRAFNKLADWFLQNPDRGKELSEKLSKNRPLLSSLEQTITRFKIAEKVESNKIDIDDLDTIFSNHNQIEEILIALGSEQNTNLLKEFKHRSIHELDYYLYFKQKYDRSTERVHEFLKSSPRYEVPESLEEWKKHGHSKTVFPAKKDSDYINIIIRPSDGDKIIIHEDAELAVLDSRLYELWTDNGIDQPKDITLGDILKTTGINVIPLRKLF